jgi:hypothetical protein
MNHPCKLFGLCLLCFLLLFRLIFIPANATRYGSRFQPGRSALAARIKASRSVRCKMARFKNGSGDQRRHFDRFILSADFWSSLWVPGAARLCPDWREQKILRRLTNYTTRLPAKFNADGSAGIASADHLAHVWRVAEDGSHLPKFSHSPATPRRCWP